MSFFVYMVVYINLLEVETNLLVHKFNGLIANSFPHDATLRCIASL
jgi:hypothetical protein